MLSFLTSLSYLTSLEVLASYLKFKTSSKSGGLSPNMPKSCGAEREMVWSGEGGWYDVVAGWDVVAGCDADLVGCEKMWFCG